MNRRVCSFKKANSERCGATPLADSDLCFWHDPEHQQEATEARRLGGLRRQREGAVNGAYGFDGIAAVPNVQRIIEIAIIDTLSLDNSPSRNRTLGALAGIALKALEVGEMEERLQAIEAALGPRMLMRPSGGGSSRVSFASRLGRVFPVLNARERAVLIIRAQAAGQEPDPEWRRINDPLERREFNRFMALRFAANIELTALFLAIQATTFDLEGRVNDLDNIESGADELESVIDPEWQRRSTTSRGKISVPRYLRLIAKEIRRDVREVAIAGWTELRVVEILWEEIRDEFEGEDPRPRAIIENWAETRSRLLAVLEHVGVKGKRLPEPDEGQIEQIRHSVDVALKFLEVREQAQ